MTTKSEFYGARYVWIYVTVLPDVTYSLKIPKPGPEAPLPTHEEILHIYNNTERKHWFIEAEIIEVKDV